MTETLLFQIDGIDCPRCADTIRRVLELCDGVSHVQIGWESGVAEVHFDPNAIDESQILAHSVFRGRYRATPFRASCC